jgi:DNA-binding XRE family transcriptional regulator
MQTKEHVNNHQITDYDTVLDNLYGKVGTPEREAFRREAYAYCMGQVILDARKSEKITQAELAKRIGTDKAYISKIEKGIIEPGVGTFYRIIEALGLRVEIVKPVY